ILAVEELLDAINRATMKDDRIHPVSRQIAKLHVAEEARHVSFAKTYLAEVWPTLGEDERQAVKSLAPAAVAMVADLTIDPAVYASAGLDVNLVSKPVRDRAPDPGSFAPREGRRNAGYVQGGRRHRRLDRTVVQHRTARRHRQRRRGVRQCRLFGVDVHRLG